MTESPAQLRPANPRNGCCPSVVVWRVASMHGGPWLELEAGDCKEAAWLGAVALNCRVEEMVVRYLVTRGGKR